MRDIITKTLSVVAILAAMSIGAVARAETIDTRIGKLNFELGVPTKATVAKIYDEIDFQRACQLYLWALPAVNAAELTAIMEFIASPNNGDVVIFEGYHNLTPILTANVTTPYVGGAIDLAARGPMVVEIPAGLVAGSAMDLWQRPLTDFGVTGPDHIAGIRLFPLKIHRDRD